MKRRVFITLLVVLSCQESNAPSGPPPDVSGAWAFGQRLTAAGGLTCANRGTVTITQTTSSFTATYAQTGQCTGPGGTIDNSSSGDITDGRLNGPAVRFSIPGCSYSGTVVGDPPDGASGPATCQISVGGQPVRFSGTWHVSHGAASVSVTPNSAFLGTGATLPLTATAYDAAGNVLANRTIVWGSLAPTIATATNGDLHGVAPGFATITATSVPLLPLEDSVIGVAGVHVMTRAERVAGGYLHTCAVLAAATVMCWGAGFDGRLGNGTTDHPVDTPRLVSGAFAQVSGGFEHSCGTSSTGSASCWGKELSGELGDGVSSATRLAPVPVSGGLSFASVSAGNTFSCGVTTTGAGYCWGTGLNGRLGNGGLADDSTPVPVNGGLTFAMISTSRDAELQPVSDGFACGLTTTGTAYCWGRDGEGELGDSGSLDQRSPVPVAGGHTFATLSVGARHACAVTSNGAAFCWGKGTSGQLGNGAAVGSNVPVPVSAGGGLAFSTIAAGGSHTCGVTTGGDAYCWGINGLGQLGTGVFAPDFSPPQTTPVAVTGGLKFVTLAAGVAHTCGITTLAVIYCWGRGMDGQLGSGLANKAAPAPVLVP